MDDENSAENLEEMNPNDGIKSRIEIIFVSW